MAKCHAAFHAPPLRSSRKRLGSGFDLKYLSNQSTVPAVFCLCQEAETKHQRTRRPRDCETFWQKRRWRQRKLKMIRLFSYLTRANANEESTLPLGVDQACSILITRADGRVWRPFLFCQRWRSDPRSCATTLIYNSNLVPGVGGFRLRRLQVIMGSDSARPQISFYMKMQS